MMKIVNEESIEAKLYKIIDDIDTAFDMFKPEMQGFEKYIENRIKEARKYICSPDGYVLAYTCTVSELDRGVMHSGLE